ncbi:RNA polymerase sigma-70 factor [Nakamurella flava]|uniref:RNA polymerase sigma-70 factor n=1 Tax=Nakamurella flava TaxID=2576308 RepID=UPI00197B1C5E|nr:RNA polymerase sigma-70 factor [Nakamurella flava]
MTDPTAVFAEHRALLFTVAYEMLGSAADAEDVVQEVWLRWAAPRSDEADKPDEITHPRAYLVRITTRLALNRLRTLARRREDYVGPWLPEPLCTTADVADDVVLADSVSLAVMVVLETLSPRERAVFLLREVFGFDTDEIAVAVDRTPAAVRQIAHRAKSHVQARRPRFPAAADEVSTAMEKFLAALTSGDIQGLMDVLAPDVVLLSDGGGKKSAARRPVRGADDVARFLLGVLAKFPADVRVDAADVNGAPSWIVHLNGELDSVTQVVVVDGRITQVLFVRNPDKLSRLAQPLRLTR